jgi:hypothetical protein
MTQGYHIPATCGSMARMTQRSIPRQAIIIR